MSGELPSGWTLTVLSDVATRIQRRLEGDPEHILMITSASGFVPQSEKYGRFMAGESLAKYVNLHEGEFSYNRGNSKSFPYGCVYRLTGYANAAVPNVYISFGLRTAEVDPDFACQLFASRALDEHLSTVITSGVRGNGLLNISADEFFKAPLRLPPLAEQKKIAAILSSVDEAIQVTQRVIDQTRRVKEGLLQDLLTRGLPGHTRFKHTPVGSMPASWSVRPVGEVLRIENNRRKAINREERSKMPGPYPYWGPTRVQDHIAEYRFDGSYALIGEDGDHFLKWQRSEMTMWATGRFNVNNHAHVVADGPLCLARWFFYYYMHRDLGDTLTRQGAGRFKLTKAALESLPIAVPNLDEQVRIIEIMDAARSVVVPAEARLEGLQSAKSGLLQDLLSGRVRVTP